MVVDGDSVLVKLMDKYVGAVFLDVGGYKTYLVHVVHYAERGGGAESSKRRCACELNRESYGRGRCRLHRLSRAARC